MNGRKPRRDSNSKDQRMRLQLAQEAARLIAEEGINDFHVAKHKAAERLHAPQTHNLPRNEEIQAALNEYQRLFKADSQPRQLLRLRQIARTALAFFHTFEARLVGPVLDGTATEFSEITLHLFSDAPEAVTIFLLDQHIPFEQCTRRLNMGNDVFLDVPGYQMMLEDAPVLLLQFEHKGLRQAPRDPASGRPMARMSLDKLDELLKLEA